MLTFWSGTAAAGSGTDEALVPAGTASVAAGTAAPSSAG